MKPFDYSQFPGPCGHALKRNAAGLRAAYARGVRPPPRIDVSDWAEKYRRFPSESAYPGPWKRETAPYLDEIMDCLSVHHPAEVIAIKKCAQSGGSASAENWIGYIADVAPGYCMYVQGTVRAAEDWAREKLWPMIRATPRLDPARGGAVKEQKAKDGEASTKLRVAYRNGGWLLLAGSNSAATLRQHSIRFAIEDDLDQHADDCEGQGSSEAMVDARLTTFRRQGLSKRLKISTPLVKGGSKIERAFREGDQREIYFRCPDCASRFRPLWADIQWPQDEPAKAYLVAPCCGSIIKHWRKAEMLTRDCWVPTVEIDGEAAPRIMEEAAFQAARARDVKGRPPSFSIPGIVSVFLTWADMAVKWVAAQGDQSLLRAWTNLMLGDVFAVNGEGPPADELAALIEQDWGKGQVPFGPVIFTMGCDVQGDGIYYEVVGWGPLLESWSYAYGFVAGETSVPREGAWAMLDEVAKRPVQFPGGKEFPLDQVCVDGGYHTEAAKAFCRGHPRRMVVFGRDGWTRPLLGRGEAVEFQRRGKRAGQATKRTEDRAWLVGTYGAKTTFYGYLKATLKAHREEAAGAPVVAVRGRCHFGRDHEADYFGQVTSEVVVTEKKNGVERRVWRVKKGEQNHLLDCRIYNHAATAQLQLESLTDNHWAGLREQRYASPDQGDLVALMTRPQAPARPTPSGETNSPAPAAQPRFIDAPDGYL